MKHTLAGLKALLTSNLDTVEECATFGHHFNVSFYAKQRDRRVLLSVYETEIALGASSTATNDFFGAADAYTRAAAFARMLGLPFRE